MRKERGFIMADTIIALMIVSLVSLSLMTLVGYNRSLSQKAKTQLTASLLARSLIFESSDEQFGTFEQEGVAYNWSRERIQSAPTALSRFQTVQTNVDVVWRGRNVEKSLTLSLTRLEGIDE
jgi:Tfp pilus assembly protein PilE